MMMMAGTPSIQYQILLIVRNAIILIEFQKYTRGFHYAWRRLPPGASTKISKPRNRSNRHAILITADNLHLTAYLSTLSPLPEHAGLPCETLEPILSYLLCTVLRLRGSTLESPCYISGTYLVHIYCICVTFCWP